VSSSFSRVIVTSRSVSGTFTRSLKGDVIAELLRAEAETISH
jgi:hypothetical protein